LYDEGDEARYIATKSAQLIEEGTEPRDIAVLYRANFQSRALEEAFITYGVPYQVLGIRFFERKEVKDLLSYIRAALNPDSSSDLKRIINVPVRGIGKVTLLKIVEGNEDKLPAVARQKVAEFRASLAKIAEYAASHPASQTLKYALAESGIERALTSGDEEDQERLENLRELVTLAVRYDALSPEEGILKLLEEAALASDQDELKEDNNAVKLMTVHASKGLEFKYVMVTGLEEGLFPHRSLSEDRIDDEEERRLFYVALTRARKKVFLTFTSMRTIFGSREMNIPSEFITDIDDELIDAEQTRESNSPKTVIYLD
jgi:DNA helicase II / ATP-dependent DNA helicase PcrA